MFLNKNSGVNIMRVKVIYILIFISFYLGKYELFGWRSTLYPTNWSPGYEDSEGRYLHDFSYAGYKKGETNIPYVSGTVYDVTSYGADKTGGSDSTSAIQNAINDAGNNTGGGIVYFPAGTYRVSLQSGLPYCLLINKSKVVLRGEGTNSSKIFCTNTTSMDGYKAVLLVSPDGAWGWNYWSPSTENNPQSISVDIYKPTNVITVADASGFSVGDWIVLRDDCDADFDSDHYMGGEWAGNLKGVMFYRVITGISGNNITIDIPTRYKLLSRYQARVYSLPTSHLSEIGIEKLSFGMQESSGDQSANSETSYVIDFRHVVNSWIKNVSSYCDTSRNPQGYHIRSNGIELYQCRNITISTCVFQKAQYLGDSGSGYFYILRGNDCLVEYSKGISGRHNFDFKSMFSSGNVIYKCYTEGGTKPSDFHMYLSIANLVDNMQVKNDYLEAVYRPYSTPEHGHTTTQSVFWNIESLGSSYSYLIKTEQFSNGYVIGTSGSSPTSVEQPDNPAENYQGTHPIDFVEGEGTGDSLEPASLYIDQLERRLGILNGITNFNVIISKSNNGVYFNNNAVSQNPLPGYTVSYIIKASNSKSNINSFRIYNKMEGSYGPGTLNVTDLLKQYSTNDNPSLYFNSGDWVSAEPSGNVKYIGGKTNDFLNSSIVQYSYKFVVGLISGGTRFNYKAYGIVNDFVFYPFESSIDTVTVGTMFGGRFSFISDSTQEVFPDNPLFVNAGITNKGNSAVSFLLYVTNINASTSVDDWSCEIVNDDNLTVITETPLLNMNEVFKFRIKFTHNNNVTNMNWIDFRVYAQVKNNTVATSYIGDDGIEYGGDIGKNWSGVNGVNPGFIFQQNNPEIRLVYKEKYFEKNFIMYALDKLGHKVDVFDPINYVANYDINVYVEFLNTATQYTSVSIIGALNNYNNVKVNGIKVNDNLWRISLNDNYGEKISDILFEEDDLEFPYELYFNESIITNWIKSEKTWSFMITSIRKQANNISVLDNLIDNEADNSKIVFELAGTKKVDISVFNISGYKIKQLISDTKEAGKYVVIWNGKDDNNNVVKNGIYFCVVSIGDIQEVRTIIVKIK